jgi:hypothetical protein
MATFIYNSSIFLQIDTQYIKIPKKNEEHIVIKVYTKMNKMVVVMFNL